ncbi:hypothetical protein [Amnibacterium endophyticum]|uniref:DUF2970 domain-containing protein n=1 Tax=Amnibacterium endophyticum TaxID=2109337 RepID=A0ABW4LBK4_9MICO
MAPWIVLAFGLVLIAFGVRAILLEQRAARRGRRPFRPDLGASVGLLFVLGGLAVLLALGMLLVFPRA